MKNPREAVYAALFHQLKAIAGVRTVSRTVLLFTDVSPDDQPAIYMEQTGERQMQRNLGMPNLWELDVHLGVYVYVSDAETPASGDEGIAPPSPATYLNPILDQIEQLFPGTTLISSPSQTLNKLVAQVRIAEGEKTSLGSLGPQAFAFVPLRIITT